MDSRTVFLDKMVRGFSDCQCPCEFFLGPNNTIGFGVSGGADSMALLQGAILLRKKFFGSNGARFLVVSINHNMRPQEESLEDCLFVRDFCSRQENLDFVLVDIEPGRLDSTAKIRGRGTEEAARFLRYESFTSELTKAGCQFFCLAHNQNDQLETLLLRFLQGGGDGLTQGIPAKRDFFIRPLLQISRQEIEEFLSSENINFRVDKTNQDNQYLRNRCRNLLTPLLDKEFLGWKTSLLSGAKKRQDDNEYLASLLPQDFWKPQKDGAIFATWTSFLLLHPALRRRLLFQGLNQLGVEDRIPFYLFETLVYKTEKINRGRIFSFGSVEVFSEQDKIIVRKIEKQREEFGFSLLIERAGRYKILDREILVTESSLNQSEIRLCIGGYTFNSPFIIRNYQSGDKGMYQGRVQNVQELISKNSSLENKVLVVVEELGNSLVTVIPLT